MPATVHRHDGTEHSFRLVSATPDPRLRGQVRGYHDFWERSTAPVARREVASPDAVVIVDLDAGWGVGGERHGSFAGGLYDEPIVVEHGGTARAVQIDLTPPAARALLGVPLGELSRRVVGLEDLLGADAARLAERLHAAPTSEERFTLLDRVLLGRLAAARPVRPDVARAWRRLEETAGTLRVEALADELRCSRRHLTARFAEEIGLPPKAYARVLRFRRAADTLLAGGEQRLAEVAAACGFADQSHLNREFRALAGAAPTELLARRLPDAGGLAA